MLPTLKESRLLSEQALRLATHTDLVSVGVALSDALVIAHELGAGVGDNVEAAPASAATRSSAAAGLPVLVTDFGAVSLVFSFGRIRVIDERVLLHVSSGVPYVHHHHAEHQSSITLVKCEVDLVRMRRHVD